MSDQVLSLKQAVAAMRKFQRDLHKPITQAVNRELAQGRDEAVAAVMSRTLGRKLWGSDQSGLLKFAKRSKSGSAVVMERARYSASRGTIVGGLRTKGIPAMLDAGGRIAAHKIKARPGGKLVFDVIARSFFGGGGKRIVAVGLVNHPGGRVRGSQFLKRALDGVHRRAVPAIDAGIQQLADREL